MLYIPCLLFQHFSSICSYRPACYYLDTPRQCQVPLALPASVTALPLIIPLWVHLSHWWWAPSGDRHYTVGPWILSLTHSLVIIQVEYSWFSLFVVVMFYRVVCDTEWVMLNHWTERKYSIMFMFIFGLNTCTTHSIHNLVWFYINFHIKMPYLIVVVVQLLSHVQLVVTPWTAAHQAFLSITNSQSLLKLMSIELMMPSNHLILCPPFVLLPSIFPSSRVFSNESVLRIRWPKYWSFSFSISPSNECAGLISFRRD